MTGEGIAALIDRAAHAVAESEPSIDVWSQVVLALFAMAPLILLGVLILLDTLRGARRDSPDGNPPK